MTKRNDKKKVPELRFRGFTDPWEQRQLGEVVSERNERSASGELLSISMSRGVYPTSCSDRKDNSSEDKSNYKHLAVGDIAYNSMRMWQGACGLSSFDGIISPAYTVVIPSAATDGRFLIDLFKTTEMLNTFQRNSQGLTSDTWNLKYPAFSKIKCSIPSLHEQRLIGQFFSTLDSLIAAAERQEALLKQKKQAYLQFMFPQEGENEPRLRFAGFSGEWEMRRFGEIFQYERPDAYLSGDDEIEDEGAIPVLTANKAFILGYTNSLQGIYQKGRCIIFDDFTLDSKRVEQPFKVRSSAIKILTVRENMDFDFAFELLRTSKFPVLGHARHYITVVQPQATLIPHFLQEQQRIGRFFRNFDSLIACAEERAASLRALKSAYLQRMFV